MPAMPPKSRPAAPQPEGPAVQAIRGLAKLPGVSESVEEGRQACTELRWHQALRRRIPQAAAESRVRGATVTALLEGAEVAGSRGSVEVIRDVMRGATAWPESPDPVWSTVRAAVQVTAATEEVTNTDLRAGRQVISRLHVAATSGLLPAEQVGRPRVDGETCGEWSDLGPPPSADEARLRLNAVADLLPLVPSGSLPTLLIASIAHAEIIAARPFVQGNALVARALERLIVRAGGLDPTGVAVPEAGHAVKIGADYRGALLSYCQGGSQGVVLWIQHCGQGMTLAAIEGQKIADSVLAGRTQ